MRGRAGQKQGSGPIRAYYRLRLKTLAFTLFKPSALAALTTP